MEWYTPVYNNLGTESPRPGWSNMRSANHMRAMKPFLVILEKPCHSHHPSLPSALADSFGRAVVKLHCIPLLFCLLWWSEPRGGWWWHHHAIATYFCICVLRGDVMVV